MEHISTQLTVEYIDGELARYDCKLHANGRIEFPGSDKSEPDQLGEHLYNTSSKAGASINNAWVAEETGAMAFVSANSNEDGFYVERADAAKAIAAAAALSTKSKAPKI